MATKRTPAPDDAPDNPGTPISEIAARLEEKRAADAAAAGADTPPPAEEPKAEKPKKKAKTGTVSGEVAKPDFEKAVRLYRGDIKPAKSRSAEFMQEVSTAYKAVKKDARVHPGAAKVAFSLVEMEYDKQQEWLRSFRGTLEALGIGIEADLFDGLEGEAPKSNVVPFKEMSPAPDLVTLQ
jgi:hypothetical protein